MLRNTQAIPLAIYPYSSTSQIVHWISYKYGIIATILKGSMREKSPFLNQFELFGTSKLSFFYNDKKNLYSTEACTIMKNRSVYRKNWRAMQSASYISYLYYKILPEKSPTPEFYNHFEFLLDITDKYNYLPFYIIWSELYFLQKQGNAPQFNHCTICKNKDINSFSIEQGGSCCKKCSKIISSPLIYFPLDVQAVLKTIQRKETPADLVNLKVSKKQIKIMHTILNAFMSKTYQLKPQHRNAALAA